MVKMTSLDQNPEIMANAKIDLAGNISGDFSPQDWEKILIRASAQLKQSDKSEAEAWVDIVRDFHKQRYWGFVPNYIKPKIKPEEENLGQRFIWYCFRSFLLTKIVVLYCGARYSADDPNPIYKWGFYGGLVFIVTAYGRFLWKYGRTQREE